MVMLKNMRNSHRMGRKLDKKWLGPYEVAESLSKGFYRLKSSDGSILKKVYNGFLLIEYLQSFVVGIFACVYTLLCLYFQLSPKFRMEHKKSVSTISSCNSTCMHVAIG